MDITYEGIEAYDRAMRQRLAEDRRRLFETPSHIQQVIRRDEHGVDHVLQIEHVFVSDHGTIVYVR